MGEVRGLQFRQIKYEIRSTYVWKYYLVYQFKVYIGQENKQLFYFSLS